MNSSTTTQGSTFSDNATLFFLEAVSPADNSLFPFLPRWFKLVVCLVFLVNIRSWPGQWHVRVWAPAIWAHFRSKVLRGMLPHLRDNIDKNGSDPWRFKSVKRFWAGPDDLDFQMHLSNSCYAKHSDACRMKAIVDWFSPFLVAGGLPALAGGHYNFVKQIDPLATYDVEFTIGGFGDKWIYLVGTFVGGPDSRSSPTAYSTKLDVDAGFRASLKQSRDTLSPPSSPISSSGVVTPLPKREDGRTVHCISVSQYCFKLGRLTIPPAVVLAFCGYGAQSNWERFEILYRQGPKAMKDWLRLGWKEDASHLEFEAIGKEKGAKGEAMRLNLASFATL